MKDDKDSTFDNDYEYSRDTYYKLVEKGHEGIEEMMEVAKASEHPRAYEVLSKLIKDTGDVADKLMDLNKKKISIKQALEGPKHALPPGASQTNIFVGTTGELQRLIHQENEKDVTPIEDK